jgi:hypothetical protein
MSADCTVPRRYPSPKAVMRRTLRTKDES